MTLTNFLFCNTGHPKGEQVEQANCDIPFHKSPPKFSWQRCRDLNPDKQFWRLLCYHYITPIYSRSVQSAPSYTQKG